MINFFKKITKKQNVSISQFKETKSIKSQNMTARSPLEIKNSSSFVSEKNIENSGGNYSRFKTLSEQSESLSERILSTENSIKGETNLEGQSNVFDGKTTLSENGNFYYDASVSAGSNVLERANFDIKDTEKELFFEEIYNYIEKRISDEMKS